jgi:hypothetical protein
MNRHSCSLHLVGAGSALLGLMLTGPVAAQNGYKIEPIVRVGDRVTDAQILVSGGLWIGALNDRGHLVFATGSEGQSQKLIQYADGKFTPLVTPGGEAPGGKWATAMFVPPPVSMNQLGNVVFVAPMTIAGKTEFGVFLWDYQAKRIAPLALKGMPAPHGTTFEQIGDFRTTINNRNEVAFAARVKDAAGEVSRFGVYQRAPDGQLSPVLISGQALPDGGQARAAILSVIDDLGRVACLCVPEGQLWPYTHAYLWEKGALTLLAATGTEAPGGGRFAHVDAVWLNNRNPSVLVQADLDPYPGGPRGVYRYADGQLTPIAVPGQQMPGGGIYKTQSWISVSYANELGQHAFFAEITEEGRSRTAAYLLDAEGKLSLILKSGTTTDLGTITKVGEPGSEVGTSRPSLGVGLNNRGQVALPVQFDNGPHTLVLLTPAAQ